jgi:hypothetical protein
MTGNSFEDDLKVTYREIALLQEQMACDYFPEDDSFMVEDIEDY